MSWLGVMDGGRGRGRGGGGGFGGRGERTGGGRRGWILILFDGVPGVDGTVVINVHYELEASHDRRGWLSRFGSKIYQVGITQPSWSASTDGEEVAVDTGQT